jgi:hypothetical protein
VGADWMARRLAGVCLLLLLLGAELVAPQPGTAQEGRAPEGATFLLFPTGARAVGMGRAVTALRSTEASWWNPAGLAAEEGRHVQLVRGEQVTGDAFSLSLGIPAGALGRLGGAYQLLDEGTLDATDGAGNVIGSLTLRNHIVQGSWARPLGSRLAVGATAKHVRFELGCRGQCPEGRVRSTSWAVDLGMQGRPLAAVPLDLGLSLVHLGPEFRGEGASEGDPLPARLRAGLAWEPWEIFIEEERLAVLLALDLEDRLRDPGDPAALLGAEFSAGTTDRVYVRGGYTLRRTTGLEGGAAGFGIRYDRFELDLARALSSGVIASRQDQVHLTLTARF